MIIILSCTRFCIKRGRLESDQSCLWEAGAGGRDTVARTSAAAGSGRMMIIYHYHDYRYYYCCCVREYRTDFFISFNVFGTFVGDPAKS